MTKERPDDDELEISIFGPGYGEAVAIHIGLGRWILVDSCLEPNTEKPAQLQYLESLGIDPSLAVRLIVATHWHDDHVQGMGSLVRECKSAEIVVSAALRSPHFGELLNLYGGGVFPGSSGVSEFINVFRVLDERRQRQTRINVAKLAVSDKLLFKDKIYLNRAEHDVEIYSLSPSDSAIMSAQLDFRQSIPSAGTRKTRVVSPTINNTSVVLWVKVAEHRILLGSDLQKTGDPKTGWTVIINESQAIKERALVYKVPHHGAQSSHDPNVWSKLLTDKPLALLSPYFVAGNSLPTEDDLERVAGLTPNGYITAPPKTKQFRSSDGVVRQTIQTVAKTIRSINTGWGQIRLRCKVENADYSVELFGDAYQIRPNQTLAAKTDNQ